MTSSSVKYYSAALILVIIVLSGIVMLRKYAGMPVASVPHFDESAAVYSVSKSFAYTFNVDGTLEEAGSPVESASRYWWLDSGALLNIKSGVGSTIIGDLASGDKWRLLYVSGNPTDTDNGLHPQNIFRLLTRSEWKNFRQEMYFRIVDDNMSDSPNRNESNGLLLLNRYVDSGDLYYAGIRVDGHVIIKKKLKGTYYTLVEDPLIPGSYDRAANKSLLPKNTWIGLRTEIITLEKNHVKIRLYADLAGTGEWKLVGDADDRGDKYGPVIDEAGYAGIRLDFMDVEFKGYEAQEL